MSEQPEKKQIGDYLFDWKRKFDNFLFHYTAPLIIGVLILAFVIFAIVQCAGKKQGDANVAYVGPHEIGNEQFSELQSSLNKIVGEDLNGDNEIYVSFTRFLYMTERQMENARAAGKSVDSQAVMSAQTQVLLELKQGNIIIYFIDLEVYKYLANRPEVFFMTLEESLGYTPENAYDECAVKLSDLPAGKYYMGLDSFPSNTIVTVRDMQPGEKGNKSKETLYESNLKTFRNLVKFKFPETETTESTEDTKNTEE